MKILLVDDDRLFISYALDLIKTNIMDTELMISFTGQAGLKILKRENIDVILLDIILPDINGLELLKKIRMIDSKVQIIMMTGFKGSNSLEQAFTLGANDYISKPLNEIEFIARLKAAISNSNKMTSFSDTEKKLQQLNQCFLSFGHEPQENIKKIVNAAGEITGADFVLFNQLEGEYLRTRAGWMIPEGMKLLDTAKGHICYDFMQNYSDVPRYLHRIGESSYAETDPIANQYKISSYLGFLIRIQDQCNGVLCAVYKEHHRFTDDELKIFQTLGQALQIEESRRQVAEQLEYYSLHDQLTGLYNRAYFEVEMYRLESSREYPVTLVSIDLDGLKLINDTMGHKRGDEQLKAFSVLLKKIFRRSDIIARIGGDEIIIILPRTDEKTAAKLVKRIQHVADKYNADQAGFPLSFSVGIASSNGPEQSLEETFKKADDLMYKDKLYHGSCARQNIVKAIFVDLAEKDYVNSGHTQRLQELCFLMAKKIGITEMQKERLLLLSQVHDLGKVTISENILFKKDRLNPEEWKVIKQHPEKGYRIALSCPEINDIANLILRHHEHFNGGGYPLGLKKEEIPLECRILAITDAYDAITNKRHYSQPRSQDEALREIKRCAGTQFDPELVTEFMNIIKSK